MSTLYGVVMACITVITLSPQIVNSQIPTACTDAESLTNMVCCPADCGAATGRGRCDDIDLPQDFNMSSTDVRSNWPHYFNRTCHCTGNYGGFDCSRCIYGHYGDNCENNAILPRTSIQSLTPEEWTVYIETLKMARTADSRYSAILQEAQPGTPISNLFKREVTIYELFVWLHHYTAKDSECKGINSADQCTKVDYAHEATGFPTWHRHYILWFEWEIQYMLKINGRTDYHMFRTHFWDWRSEMNMAAETIFHADRLGEIEPIEDKSRVTGNLFSDGWKTICWKREKTPINSRRKICDPHLSDNPIYHLLRCPYYLPNDTDAVRNQNPCHPTNKHWPNSAAVEAAISKPSYDTPYYDISADNDMESKPSFRNFMEGFENVTDMTCLENRLCRKEDNILRHLHNAVHIIIGMADFRASIDDDHKGVMADVASSPNDPIFINHHTMIDCILEEWLKRPHLEPEYPEDVGIKGHRKNDYIVPFFPLYKHSDRFKTANNFGYSCALPPIETTQPPSTQQPRPPSPQQPQPPNNNSAALSKPFNWMVLLGAMGSFIYAMDI